MSQLEPRQQAFRNAMAHLSAAVNVITSNGPAGRCGITATAVCSVTDSPPTLMLCINRNSEMNTVFKANGRLCVNVLSGEHEEVARHFAGMTEVPMERRFALHDWREGLAGLPVLHGALANLQGRIAEVQEIGTHSVLLLELVSRFPEQGGRPVYFSRSLIARNAPRRAKAWNGASRNPPPAAAENPARPSAAVRRRDRVSADHMGDRFRVAFGEQRDLAHRQGLADLHQAALGDHPAVRRGTPQEVDGQAGGHRQRDDADLAQYRHVQRDIGDGHQGRPGDRAAGAQVAGVDRLPDRGATLADGFDHDPGLGKFALDETGDLLFLVGHGTGPWQ